MRLHKVGTTVARNTRSKYLRTILAPISDPRSHLAIPLHIEEALFGLGHGDCVIVLQAVATVHTNILVDLAQLQGVLVVLEGGVDRLELELLFRNIELPVQLLLYSRTYQIVVELPFDDHGV